MSRPTRSGRDSSRTSSAPLVVRRLRRLAPRERLLLYLGCFEGQPVTAIASRVGVSRVHCYRLARKALFELTRPGPDEAAASGAT